MARLGYSGDGFTQRLPRVGLISGRNGVPLIVLFLQSVCHPEHRELRSLEQVESLRSQSANPFDQAAWKKAEAFFLCGGGYAYALLLPLGDAQPCTLLGTDSGYSARTGLQRLRFWAEKADILVIPQLCELIDAASYVGVVQKIFDLLGDDQAMLYLLDLPLSATVEEAERHMQSLFSPDAAVFHPWLLCNGQPIPPSLAIAAWLQQTDQQVGIQEIASEISLASCLRPISRIDVEVRQRLLATRVNTFLVDGTRTHVWGGYTLADRADWKSRLIPLRRSSVKLRHAAEQLCEPFVLEAAGEELPVWVENSLQNFLRSVRGLFKRDLQEPFSTEVELIDQNGENRLQVRLEYALPHALERFSLSFVA